MSSGGDEAPEKRFRLLGILDVQNVPCARESVLYGAAGSLALGLTHFLFTSRVKRSVDVGFAGFLVTTLGSWMYCRAINARLRVQQRYVKEGIKNKVAYEGTNLDPNKSAATQGSSGTS